MSDLQPNQPTEPVTASVEVDGYTVEISHFKHEFERDVIHTFQMKATVGDAIVMQSIAHMERLPGEPPVEPSRDLAESGLRDEDLAEEPE